MATKCVVPKCKAMAGNVKDFKGLCMKCYSSAKKMVTAEETTWEQLEEKGLAILSNDPFREAFNDAPDHPSDG